MWPDILLYLSVFHWPSTRKDINNHEIKKIEFLILGLVQKNWNNFRFMKYFSKIVCKQYIFKVSENEKTKQKSLFLCILMRKWFAIMIFNKNDFMTNPTSLYTVWDFINLNTCHPWLTFSVHKKYQIDSFNC